MMTTLAPPGPPSLTRPAARQIVFFVATIGFLLAIITKQVAKVLPDGLAAQIGHNRESLLYVPLIVVTVQLVRPWVARQRQPMLVILAYGAALVILAQLLKHSGWATDVTTLNEPITAAGLLAVYVQPRRPLRWGPWLSLVLVVLAVVLYERAGATGTPLPFVLDQAETLGFLVLGPLTFDLFDRTILDRDAPERPGLRLAWLGFLAVLWVGLVLGARQVRPELDNAFELAVDLGHRSAEGTLGTILVSLYFSYWLRGVLPSRTTADRTPATISV